MSRYPHKTYMKATKGSVSCVIKRIWQLQLELYSIKVWGGCGVDFDRQQDHSHVRWETAAIDCGFFKRPPASQRKEETITWQNGQWLQVSSLCSLSTWPGEEERVEISAPIMSTTVLRRTAYSYLCLSDNCMISQLMDVWCGMSL